jgi:flagellar basal-body rod protein FlgF
MIRGMETAARAMKMQIDREEVLTRNLENLGVPGFKQETTSTSGFVGALDRAQRANEGPLLAASTRTTLIGGVGLNTQIDRVSVKFDQGTLEKTDRNLDVALEGDGFLKVRTPDGDFFSRGGALHVDGMGRLTTSEGYFVLGSNGEIVVPSSSITISSDGSISDANGVVDQLNVEEFAPGTLMAKAGDVLYAPDDATATSSPATATSVKSGFLESSNVDDIAVLTEMTTAVRMYQANQRMLQVQDELLGRAVNELGRV